MGVPDLPDLGAIWGGNTMGAGGAASVMDLSGTPAVASDAAIANMNAGATDPFAGNTMNSSWWDRNAPSNKQLQDALGALGKGAGPAGGGAAAGKGATGGPALGAAGKPGQGTGVSLTPLLQLLAKRREDLMNSATAGVGMGQPNPQGAGRVQGLLGF